MKHFTFRQVKNSAIASSRKYLDFVTPTSCGNGEFVTIGNRNTVTAVFIASPELDTGTDFNALFNLSHDTEQHISIIQYHRAIGGYLYTWANY